MDNVKLLIIDDEENVIDGLANTIGDRFENEEMEYETDPSDAVQKIIDFKPDIIITDINFSSGNKPSNDDDLSIAGIALARKVRKEFPLIKIIASSGYRNDDIVFEKITEKDWYDEFYTKGSEDLLEKYEKVRNEVLTYKTGLIPKLSKFFAPTNYDWDIDKSIYRILHTNFEREENLQYLDQIIEYYNTFKESLSEDNKELLDNIFETYRKRDLTEEEREKVRKEFYFEFDKLEELENRDFPGQTFYAEKLVLHDVWDKIISETKDHSELSKTKFNYSRELNGMTIFVEQPNEFDFEKFISSNKTLSIYQKIRNYGKMSISSGNKKFDIVTEKLIETGSFVEGTIISLDLKIIPTVKKRGHKR